MERITMGERKIVRKGDECLTHDERRNAILTRRLFGFVPLRCSTLLLAICFFSVGCSSFGFLSSDRDGLRRGEYAYQDESVAKTWAEASNHQLREGEQRVSAKKPFEPYTVTSDVNESKEPSFTEKMASVFHPQKTTRTNSDAVYADNHATYARQAPNSRAGKEKTTYAADNLPEKKNGTSFWSKMFPSKQTATAAEGDNYVVVETRRNNGAKSYGSRNPVTQTPPRSNNFKTASTNFLGKLKPNQSKRYAQRPDIETYEQSRFLPEFADIQKYYYPSGTGLSNTVAPGMTAPVQGQVATTNSLSVNDPTTLANKLANVDDALPRSAYGASYQTGANAPFTRSSSENETLIASVAGRRNNGSAFISPIVSADANVQTKREGNIGNTSLGVTRKIESDKEVAQVSYAEQRRDVSARRLGPDSLFGWNEEENVVLNSPSLEPQPIKAASPQIATTSTADSDFMSSLGKQVDSSWFDSTPRSLETQNVSNNDVEVEDENWQSQDEERYSETTEYVGETVSAKAAREVVQFADPNASLDDIFDAAVSTSSNAVVDYEDDELPTVDELTSNYEEINELEDFSNDVLEEEFVPLEEATSLVDAIAQYAEPLTDTQEENGKEEDGELQERLLKQATEAAESTLTPATIDARKTTKGLTPLTNEEIAWVEQIKGAIQALLRERETIVARGGDSRSCDARLRLLYVVIGEYERSIQDIQDDSDPLKVFWEKECRGLETLLQNSLEEIDPSFVADRLLSGVDSLSDLCPLKIRKALLVKEPACYGLYEANQSSYNEGDVVYAYTELDYVTSRETKNGYNIEVECRWRLLDSFGNVVIPFESQRCSNLSETKLRDVVLNVSIPLLDEMCAGSYTLELEVVDMNAKEPTTSVKRIKLSVGASENASI